MSDPLRNKKSLILASQTTIVSLWRHHYDGRLK